MYKTSREFRFKQFTVFQQETGAKVGTDGVLLGAWTDFANARNVLDIGTGTGLIALMAAQRCKAEITALDIDESACRQAGENFALSLWKDRLHVVLADFKNCFPAFSGKFDVVVSNPPFFKNSLKNPEKLRATARHDDQLPLSVLAQLSLEAITENGKIFLIFPADREAELINEYTANSAFINRITYVLPLKDKPPKRILVEISRFKSNTEISELIIETDDRHHFSEEYIHLTKDFYLKF